MLNWVENLSGSHVSSFEETSEKDTSLFNSKLILTPALAQNLWASPVIMRKFNNAWANQKTTYQKN